MSARDIVTLKKAEPFRPFRIHMASGRTFEIRRPEMIQVGLYDVIVFEHNRQDKRIYESFKMLGMQRMKSIELIDTPVAQNQE